ncbi:MAG: sugar ABC transporter permease [Tyzzerella sp.]|nr:sugar ABC transporter permease [Tyzzerella sp.]
MKKEKKRSKLAIEIWNAKYLYLMLIPFVVWLILFEYVPMAGNVLAFKEYNAVDGLFGSPGVGLKHFERLFSTPKAVKAIFNTIILSLQRIVFEFPVPIILALITTEMRGKKIKKVYQTVLTFPHFLSWVVVSAILISMFSEAGAVNSVMSALGIDSIPFLSDSLFFRAMLFITHNWKEMGWASIIYMATISSIDPGLYEAAEIDGASRLKQIWHVTLPALLPLISMRLILKIGSIMSAGFGQILTMRNSVVSESVQILDTYIYDITFRALPNYGFSTAVGLFKGIINFALLMLANQLVGKLTGEKMWSFEKRKKTK